MGKVDLNVLTKTDVEHIIALINSRPNKASTKADNKLLIRKLLSVRKTGQLHQRHLLPSEARWIILVIKETNPRVTPETLITQEEIIAS